MDRGPDSSKIGKAMVAITVAMPVILWVYGIPVALLRGCDPGSAPIRATAYALSWLPGWFVYCGVMGRPRSRKGLSFMVWGYITWPGMFNSTMLGPKARPWPFAEMLRFGALSSVAFALVMGSILRAWNHFREPAATGEPAEGVPPGSGH